MVSTKEHMPLIMSDYFVKLQVNLMLCYNSCGLLCDFDHCDFILVAVITTTKMVI